MRTLTGKLLLACALVAFTPAALAALDIDFGAAVTLGDDDDVFLTVAAHYSDQDKERVRDLGHRYRNPDDLAVALFIMKHSGRPAHEIWRHRKAGRSWHEIAGLVGLDVGVFFVDVQRPPGPPYGKAYGHWKKRHKHKAHHFVLADDDVRHLVSVRVLHEYYGVSVEAAMEWRASGRSMRDLVAEEYHRRHAKAHKVHKGGKPHKASHAKHREEHADAHGPGQKHPGKGKKKR